MIARGVNPRGAPQCIHLESRVIGDYGYQTIGSAGGNAAKGCCFDAGIVEVCFSGLVGIESNAERLGRDEFDICCPKLSENFSKLLKLVGVVRRNQNRAFCRRH